MSNFKELRNRKTAARDIARLFSSELCKKQSEKIGGWTSAEASYRNEFQDTLHMLSDMEVLADSPEIRALVNEPIDESRSQVSEKLSLHWPGLSVAASLLFLAVAGFVVFQNYPSQPALDSEVLRYVTRIGERKTVELKDGSVITLNTGSELLVRLSEQERQISLDRGEAFFSVAKDPVRPFSVVVGSRAISVLGTAFNVRRNPDSFTVAVVDGMIALRKREEQVDATAPLLHDELLFQQSPVQQRLGAGWMAEFNAEHNELSVYALNNVDTVLGWREGLLHFEGKPLVKVVQELNRYSGKKVMIEDADIMDMEIYAAVKVDQINSAITALESMYPIKVIHYFDHVSIVGKD